MNYNSEEPKLIDEKLIIYFRDHKKNRPKTSYENMCDCCIDFLKKNYGFILLFSLIIILLYIRRIEVVKKKEYIQKLKEENKINKININKLDY